jgi:hypothetical protein
MTPAEPQHNSLAFTVGMITAGCGLVFGSMLPGAPAFFGFVLGFIVGFLGTSAFLYSSNSRSEDTPSGEGSYETKEDDGRGRKSAFKQDRDTR